MHRSCLVDGRSTNHSECRASLSASRRRVIATDQLRLYCTLYFTVLHSTTDVCVTVCPTSADSRRQLLQSAQRQSTTISSSPVARMPTVKICSRLKVHNIISLSRSDSALFPDLEVTLEKEAGTEVRT